MTVDDILEHVLEREGWPTYSEHPHDKGGPTKGGITLRTLESWRHRRCTRKELQRLDKKEALYILQRRYVETNGIQRLSGHPLQAQVVDSAVLSGPVIAVKELQQVLRVSDDGICGSITMKAVEDADGDALSNAVAVARSLRLARIVVKRPDQLVFLSGWLKRALSFVRTI